MSSTPCLAITMGDVNGIGPEILAKALARPEPWSCCRPIVIGSRGLLEPGLACVSLGESDRVASACRKVPVTDAGFPAPRRRPGVLDPEAGRCAVEWTKAAVRMAMDGRVDGIVTCPISKECIQQAGYPYTGHTTLIAEMTASADYRMCLFTDVMRIVHVSAHLALRDALDAVKTERIVHSIHIGHEALVRLGITPSRIAVAGVNPHAGENGLLGAEEQTEIRPAIEACRADGIACSGPYPPDTVFRRMREGEFDMVIAMYHDQGHIPLKLIAMDEGVNVTLGIPIVRTSVDHGTAFDIAGTGRAREHSLCAAIRLAARFAAVAGGRPPEPPS